MLSFLSQTANICSPAAVTSGAVEMTDRDVAEHFT